MPFSLTFECAGLAACTLVVDALELQLVEALGHNQVLHGLLTTCGSTDELLQAALGGNVGQAGGLGLLGCSGENSGQQGRMSAAVPVNCTAVVLPPQANIKAYSHSAIQMSQYMSTALSAAVVWRRDRKAWNALNNNLLMVAGAGWLLGTCPMALVQCIKCAM